MQKKDRGDLVRIHLILAVILVLALLVVRASGTAAPRPPELVLQNGHSDDLESFSWRPDGKLLATGSQDHTAKLWDAATGCLLCTLGGHTAFVRTAFSPDGKALVTWCRDFPQTEDRTARLWDTATGKLLAALPHSGPPHAAAWSPDGRILATADGKTVRLWDGATGRPIGTLAGHEARVNDLAFSADGRSLASADLGLKPLKSTAHARLWDLQSRKTVAVTDLGPCSEMALAPGGRLAASAPLDGPPSIRDLSGKKPPTTLEGIPGRVRKLAWSADGRILAAAFDNGPLGAWETATGKLLGKAKYRGDVRYLVCGPGNTLYAAGEEGITAWDPVSGLTRDLPVKAVLVAPSPDGHTLAVAPPREKFVEIRDAASGETVRNMRGATMQLMRVLFLSDGRTLVTRGRQTIRSEEEGATREALIASWDSHTGVPRTTAVEGPLGEDFALPSPDGRIIAVGGEGLPLSIQDTMTGKTLSTLGRAVVPVAWDPAGRILLDASGDLWDVVTGKVLARLRGLDDEVRLAAFRPDGKAVAVGPQPRVFPLRVYGLDGKPLGKPGPKGYYVSLAWSPDGKRLAAYGDAGTIIWNPATWRRQVPIHGEKPITLAMAWSPDGKLLATGEDDDTARIWDSSTGRSIRTLRGHSGFIHSVAFTGDGLVLVTASEDNTARVWRVATGECLAIVTQLEGGEDWIAVSPEGFFDGSPAGMSRVLWRLGESLFDTAKPEQYFADFYEPGLLSEVLRTGETIPTILRRRRDARADLRIAERDRRLPIVSMEAMSSSEETAVIRVRVDEAPPDGVHSEGAGARDVRLFRNGVLAARWSGDRSGILEARIPLEAGENRLTAYAFNRDGVKSEDAQTVARGPASPSRKPQAFILAIGINRYENPRWNLRYAADDARAVIEALGKVLPAAAESIVARALLDREATREGILGALRDLAGKAAPGDTVVVTYSGHGILHKGRFYLVPHDGGAASDEDAIAKRGVSDADLEEALLPLQAGRVVLVLDACHSGQALESEEARRGPLNARGLAQLAWEKGMEVLTASQSQQAALEAWEVKGRSIGHGLLTWALILEGLGRAPRRDGVLYARDWLDYAASRVPELLATKEVRQRAIRLGAPEAGAPVQTPRVFHRREGGGEWPVTR